MFYKTRLCSALFHQQRHLPEGRSTVPDVGWTRAGLLSMVRSWGLGTIRGEIRGFNGVSRT